jgi:hypothetical protein
MFEGMSSPQKREVLIPVFATVMDALMMLISHKIVISKDGIVMTVLLFRMKKLFLVPFVSLKFVLQIK